MAVPCVDPNCLRCKLKDFDYADLFSICERERERKRELEREFHERAEMVSRFANTAACLSSLTRILEQTLQHQHVILRKRHPVESLLKKVRLLQYSLENSSPRNSKKIISLEVKVINLKNLIEKRIRDQLYSFTTRPLRFELTFSSNWLKKVKGKLSFIKQLLIEIEEESGVQDLQPGAESPEPAAPRVVGLDNNDFKEVKQLLLSNSPKLEIVSLVGMGGIGKTTLGRAIYNDSSISYHFHIRAWVTVSQSFDVRQSIITLLDSMENHTDEMLSLNTTQLKQRLYQSLKGRRYLIVMDDVWECNVWDNLERLFPNERNRSRILLTTRFKNVAVYVKSSLLHVHFLNEAASWELFRDKVFGKDRCPTGLEEFGKRIVRNCQGLPLAIVIISGLLSKATRTQNYWKNIAEHLSSVIIANDEQCMKTLSLSYSVLPRHLKRCFLYMAIFPEDCDIYVSTLVKLWVIDEELLKLEKSKNFEDLAYEYLLDLVGRSLILVDKQSSTGKIKTCKIHDLIRDFCMREAKKDMFFRITDRSLYDIPMGADLAFLCIRRDTPNVFPCDEKKLSSLIVRSLVSFDSEFCDSLEHLNSRQLRAVYTVSGSSWYYSRYLWSSSECKFRNLQTLIFQGVHPRNVSIWNKPQLRHVQGKELFVPGHFERRNCNTVLENLQALSTVTYLRCTKEILEITPNLKKLGVQMTGKGDEHYLNNLVHLHKLEVLKLRFIKPMFSSEEDYVQVEKFSLPPSLKKLTIRYCHISQEDMVIFGSLPNLEVLKLRCNFNGQEWEPTAEEFLQLKYLHLQTNLKHWRADSIHYPSLQSLIIKNCKNLEEIPCGFGEISTLELIQLHNPTPSLMVSARKIQDEQLDLGNDAFKLTVLSSRRSIWSLGLGLDLD